MPNAEGRAKLGEWCDLWPLHFGLPGVVPLSCCLTPLWGP